ncbi:fimbria/pilus outer membrane usher protein [Pseudomonas sp. CAM1A]|uniref:fimbria/pilus outer membrane usher protein n=1 Tax=Pseudomonas sp. CAM1A TaxID=3231717 RepID=UPI0039C5B732
MPCPNDTCTPVSPVTRLPPRMLIAALFVCGTSAANANDARTPAAKEALASFNPSLLKSRGIDSRVADYFSHTPRFAAGTRRISLQVNGNPRGTLDARFDSDGQLCFDKALLEQAGLKLPEAGLPNAGCDDFLARYPQTQSTLRPARQEVELVVPAAALRAPDDDSGLYHRGGVGGLVNYDLLGQASEFSGDRRRYYSSSTELGFNADDWIVRSRQSYTVQNGTRNFQNLYTYVQRTFVEHKVLAQAGEINTANSVFPGASITGLQVFPEQALYGKSKQGATVTGIAQGQARVEVRQAGALIYTTLVPPGPFSLTDIPLLNSNTDLDVQVIETNGERRRFNVPAASLVQFNSSAPGYSFAAGKLRTFNAKGMLAPMMATGSGSWRVSPANLLSAGVMLADNDYSAVAWSLGSQLTADTSLNLRNTLSHAGQQQLKGHEVSAALSTQFTERFAGNVNATRRSTGYRELLDTTYTQTSRYRHDRRVDQYGLGLSWSNPLLGGFGLGYSTSLSAGSHKSERLTASWNKNFEHFSVSTNVEHSLGHQAQSAKDRRDNRNYRDYRDDTAVYLSVSVPLGGSRSLRSYANKRDGITRLGASFNDNSNEFASYSVSAERNQQGKRDDLSANANLLPRYTSVSLGYSQSGNDSTSYNGQLRGGVALHGDGVTFSPYPLNDTFAVAKVGDVPGVRLDTPSGPVWTDGTGRAVVAQVPAYQRTNVEVRTTSLPRNLDIQNGYKTVMAGRGSVQALDFPVVTSRRVLLTIAALDGAPLGKGLPVFGAANRFVTTTVEGGKAFITNHDIEAPLTMHMANGGACRLDFSLPDKPDLEVYFEKAQARCTPL